MYTESNNINIGSMFNLRIVNKSRQHVIVNLFGQNQTYDWREFNRMFVVRDKIYAYFDEETVEKINNASETICDFAENIELIHSLHVLGGRVPMLTQFVVGHEFETLQCIFPLFNLDQIIKVCIKYNNLYKKALSDKRKEEETANIVSVEVPQYAETKSGRKVQRDIVKTTTMSMGDVKGADKLKAMFN